MLQKNIKKANQNHSEIPPHTHQDGYKDKEKKENRDFPGGTVVKNPPARAGDTRHRFNLWSGKIPHTSEQLSPCVTTTELACHNYRSSRAYSLCSTTREATATRSLHTATKSSPCSLQLEEACAQQRRPNTAKKKGKQQVSARMQRNRTLIPCCISN